MAQSLFQCRVCCQVLWLAAYFMLIVLPAPGLGQESSIFAPRGADQSLEALRDQVREGIEKCEAEIVNVDNDIQKINSLLEARRKESADAGSSGDFEKNAQAKISQLSETKTRFQAKLAELRASAAAMAEREKALQAAIEIERATIRQLIERSINERNSPQKPLPPLTNAAIKIFNLAHAPPQELAKVIDSIFSPAQLRLSIDDRTKSLVVMGDKESLEIVETLLMKMDQPAGEAADGRSAPPAAGYLQARSLLLRVFWLADGLAEGEGQDPGAYLPQSVLEALKRLGLQSPQLVTQTVNSLAARDGVEVRFATQVPAVLLGQHATLNCTGSMSPMDDDHAGVDVDIHVSGPAINCELKGSLATPLGHYMVLGTANSVIAEPMVMAGGEMEMGGGGRGMMRGGEGGFGDEGGGFRGAEGGMGMEAMAPQTPKYNTSRFAFVVQVIEGESFPAE